MRATASILALLIGTVVAHRADAQAGFSPPKLASRPKAFYPQEFARAGVEGTVTVDFLVGEDGGVEKILSVQSPDPRLTLLAAMQLKQWRFTPATKGGVPVKSAMRVPMVFRPRPDSSPAGLATTAMSDGLEEMKYGDYDDAIDAFTEALRLESDSARVLAERARAHALRAQSGRAVRAEAGTPPRGPGFGVPGTLAFGGLRPSPGPAPPDPAGGATQLKLSHELKEHDPGKDRADAIADLTEAIRLDPGNPEYREARGLGYQVLGDTTRAILDFDAEIRLAPDSAAGYAARAAVERLLHRDEEALDDGAQVLRFEPANAGVLYETARILYQRGDYTGAAARLEKAVAVNPGAADAQNLLAWLRAACPDPALRDGRQAVAHATEACAAAKWGNYAYLDTLAAAYAETGDFDHAAYWENESLSFPVRAAGEKAGMRDRLGLYRRRAAYREPAPDAKANAWEDLSYHTFQTVWGTVNDSYFDPGFGGVDWAAVRERYRGRLTEAGDRAKLRALLQAMLGELHRTHFSILPGEGAVFDPSERSRIGSIGTEEAFIEGQVVFTEVRPGMPGAAAGIRPGDAVLGMDGVDMEPLLASLAKAGCPPGRVGLYMTGFVEFRLGGAVGSKIRLRLEAPGGGVRDVAVTSAPADGIWSDPVGSFPSEPVRIVARRGADGVAELRFSAFVPQLMKGVRDLLRSLAPTDVLVLDLRGNPGGISDMACGISGLLSDHEFSLGAMHMRKGLETLDVYPQPPVFRGAVAVLVDGQTASTGEILAAGLQESRRARIFGEKTAGAALPSLFKRLPSGDLFQYAIADTTTPAGSLIEGNGVTPDEGIARTRADLAAGRDPVAAAARRWLEKERRLE